MEISEWESHDKQISLRLGLGRRADGRISIYFPWEPSEAQLDQMPCPIQSEGQGVYTIDLQDADGKWLTIIG